MSKEEDLRWRLDLLKKALDEGKISFVSSVADGVRESFKKVRTNLDGSIDLSTVDARIRSMALADAHFHNRDEVKNLISLADVQSRYFEFIEATFGDIFKEMNERSADAQSCAWALSRQPEAVTSIHKIISPFTDQLARFWASASESCEYHLQDLRKLKGVFGGDLFPNYARNIASSTGLYLDTLVLTDPFMNSRLMFDVWDPQTAVRYFVKHGLNVLGYKQLALANLACPVVVIVPFRSSFDEEDADQIEQMALPDTLKHGSTLFGRDFSDLDELKDFTEYLDTVEKAAAAIRRPDRFLIDADWRGPLAEQLTRATDEQFLAIGLKHPGTFLLSQCVGRMRQATDLLLKSRNLLGTPLVEAETSWKYLNWKLEYDAALAPDELVPLHIVKGLQRAAETDMEWIGNIPPEALIEMRREGAMYEIREMISNGVGEVAETNPTNFFRSTDRIVDNIQESFLKHQENIRALRSKGYKFWGQEIGSWIVKGSIEIGAAIAGTPAWGLAAVAIDQVVESPKLTALPGRFRELQTAKEQHAKSPMGLFFKHRN